MVDILRQNLPRKELPKDIHYSVWVEAYVPDLRKRDMDNIQKALLDAISHSRRVWDDDSQIRDLRTRHAGLQRRNGCVRVHIREILNPETKAT